MNRNIKVFVAFLCSWMIAGAPLGSMAAGVPAPPSGLAIDAPVTPPGNDGLLSGMTPGNMRVPSGWSLVRATDFEGAKPTGETWILWQASVQTDRFHSGTKSLGGTYSFDQADVGWRLSGSTLGSFSEVYLSFYEYIDSQALFNDEFFLARFSVSEPIFQEVIADWYWAPTYNSPRATMYIVPQGSRSWRTGAKQAVIPKGAWHQWEIHYRPNTSALNDGFFRIYLDGVIFTSAEKANLNGTVNMNSATVQVGGVYTLLSWSTNYPTCTVAGSGIGSGTDACTSSMRWIGQSFSAPHLHPPFASFKRYLDDIIVLKK